MGSTNPISPIRFVSSSTPVLGETLAVSVSEAVSTVTEFR